MLELANEQHRRSWYDTETSSTRESTSKLVMLRRRARQYFRPSNYIGPTYVQYSRGKLDIGAKVWNTETASKGGIDEVADAVNDEAYNDVVGCVIPQRFEENRFRRHGVVVTLSSQKDRRQSIV